MQQLVTIATKAWLSANQSQAAAGRLEGLFTYTTRYTDRFLAVRHSVLFPFVCIFFSPHYSLHSHPSPLLLHLHSLLSLRPLACASPFPPIQSPVPLIYALASSPPFVFARSFSSRSSLPPCSPSHFNSHAFSCVTCSYVLLSSLSTLCPV